MKSGKWIEFFFARIFLSSKLRIDPTQTYIRVEKIKTEQ